MTLSEIENRIQAIIKELDELREKANKIELEVKREVELEVKRGVEQDDEQEDDCLDIYDDDCWFECWEHQYSPKEEELHTLRSKIYKLQEEWDGLARKKLQFKRTEDVTYKYCNVFVDDKYILGYLKTTETDCVTIDFVDKYSVRVKHPYGQRVAFVTGKGISPDLSVGQIIYNEK